MNSAASRLEGGTSHTYPKSSAGDAVLRSMGEVWSPTTSEKIEISAAVDKGYCRTRGWLPVVPSGGSNGNPILRP